MHHAGTEDLDPAGSLARGAPAPAADPALHIHLGGWLREWEEGRTEARARRAKEALREQVQGGLEIDEADAFVDAQPLDLREGRGMGGVEEVAAIDVAGNEDANRRGVPLEGAHLHRRRMRAQQPAALQIERIVRV